MPWRQFVELMRPAGISQNWLEFIVLMPCRMRSTRLFRGEPLCRLNFLYVSIVKAECFGHFFDCLLGRVAGVSAMLH